MAAVLRLLAVSDQPTIAAGALAPCTDGISANMGSSDATDFSAARRRGRYRGGGNAAGLAF